MKRKKFLKRMAASSGAFLITPTMVTSQTSNETFSKEEIQEFVFAAHRDLDTTEKIVEARPLLLNCTNQFKKGDFETAVGGASHMGRRDIVDLLVNKGARLDLFNYTFLGYTDFIIRVITDYPHLIQAPGPHGFTLLHHARAGNQSLLEEWLLSKGLTETRFDGIF